MVSCHGDVSAVTVCGCVRFCSGTSKNTLYTGSLDIVQHCTTGSCHSTPPTCKAPALMKD